MKISCSKLARPMVCAGFLYLDLPKLDGDTVFNKEGTAAGEYLEWRLTGQHIREVASNNVYINDDMKFFVDPIVDDIMSRKAENSPVLCEIRIDWQTKAGVTIKGRYDACYVDKEGRLVVEDLKYGFGIVEVKENWQFLGYAIGEVIRRNQSFPAIVLRVRQPRAHHEHGPTRDWVISYQELMDYHARIEQRMMDIVSGERTLTTSSQCKYCPGAAEACPAFNRLFHRALEISTGFHQDSITDEELARQLDEIKRAEEAIKTKKDSLVELGSFRIREGAIIPGYVQTNKYSNRAWKDGVTPEAVEMMTGKNITERTIMTPAKAEKAGVSKELVKHLSEKRFIGVKLEKKNATEIGNGIFGKEKPQMEVK